MSQSIARTYAGVPAARNRGGDARPALVPAPGPQDVSLRGWTPPSTSLPPAFTMREYNTWSAERNTLGHGVAFAELFGHACRYSYAEDAWYVYDSRAWVRDNGELMGQLRLLVRRRYQDDARRLERQARQLPDGDERQERERNARLEEAKRFARHVDETLATPKALAAMVDAARETMRPDGSVVRLTVHPDEFDTHPHLLCVQNCVVDLRTGAPRPHDPALMLSKIAPSLYLPGAEAPRFLQAVNQIMGGDTERVAYLQRVLGYLLTAEARERKVVVFYGKTGSNGKTTLANIVMRLLGRDHASGLPVATLLASRFGANEIDVGLTSINGKRIVVAVEPNKGARFNTGVVKALSGNDEGGIQARRPHQRELESVRPGAKILLLTNHLPVWEDDQAFNERFLVVPFKQVFRGSTERQNLAAELVEQEGPGILAWLVEGARLYYERGLDVPSDVCQESEAYRLEADLSEQWFEACCTEDPGATAPVLQLYQSYAWYLRTHLHAHDADVLSAKAFSRELDRWCRGRSRARFAGAKHPATVVRGIRLLVAADGEVGDEQPVGSSGGVTVPV